MGRMVLICCTMVYPYVNRVILYHDEVMPPEHKEIEGGKELIKEELDN